MLGCERVHKSPPKKYPRKWGHKLLRVLGLGFGVATDEGHCEKAEQKFPRNGATKLLRVLGLGFEVATDEGH
jgi:hypothetical protein